MIKVTATVSVVIIVFCLITGSYVVMNAPKVHCGGTTIAGGKMAVGGPFELVRHTGELVTDIDVITGPSLIYFGFTYCPDVCPLDSARNAEAIDLLDQMGHDVELIFITIDPARDTPEVLADYVEVMHPKMIGLTGTEEQVKVASKAFKTYYRKNGEGEDYLMDHSTFSYLMNTNGLVDFFRRDISAEDMAKTISCYIEEA